MGKRRALHPEAKAKEILARVKPVARLLPRYAVICWDDRGQMTREGGFATYEAAKEAGEERAASGDYETVWLFTEDAEWERKRGFRGQGSDGGDAYASR